ncbi:unnamed protein product [Rhizophagus irregularis]|nr:unnamed protein product [Rhizophagus irregularis]
MRVKKLPELLDNPLIDIEYSDSDDDRDEMILQDDWMQICSIIKYPLKKDHEEVINDIIENTSRLKSYTFRPLGENMLGTDYSKYNSQLKVNQ